MKAKNYSQILKARGYKPVLINEYQGTDLYRKTHATNEVICSVEKDSHGKAQTMTFEINQYKKPQDFEQFKKSEFDREFLWREANKIHEAFEQLKQMKAPKHLYCF